MRELLRSNFFSGINAGLSVRSKDFIENLKESNLSKMRVMEFRDSYSASHGHNFG